MCISLKKKSRVSLESFTFANLSVKLDDLVHEGGVSVALDLGLAHDLRVSTW